MSYLPDTCVLSETIKPRPNPGVVDWLRQQRPERLFIASLSLGLTLVTRNEKTTATAPCRCSIPGEGSPYAFPECGRRFGRLAAKAGPSIVE